MSELTRNNEEEKMQARLYQDWRKLRLKDQQFRRLWANFQNPKNKVQGGQLKAIGLTKGVADLTYIEPRGMIIYIELKVKGGSQSDDQKAFQKMCDDLGIRYYLVWNDLQFWQLIHAYEPCPEFLAIIEKLKGVENV